MFNLVILMNDLKILKAFCNFVLKEIPEVRLINIATSLNEFDEINSKVDADILFMNYLDVKDSKYYNSRSKSKVLRIIYCDHPENFKNTSTQLHICNSTNMNEITKFINNYIDKQNSSRLRKRITKILEAFQFDFKLIGTSYLLESILYCYENKTDYVFENLEKKVYPHVANICHCTPDNLKFSIIRAVNTMNANISKEAQKTLSKNLKVDISEKNTAKQLISTIITQL